MTINKALTQADKQSALKRALCSYANAEQRWAEHAKRGLDDRALEQVLRAQLGIAGGSGGPDCLSVHYQGAGLKIWAAWGGLNHVTDAPIYEGAGTIKAARLLFGIKDPNDDQLDLFG